MSTWSERRILTVLGAIALLALQTGGALLLLQPPPAVGVLGPRVPAALPDLLGAVEYYGDDVLTVTGSQGLQEVRLDASTVLTTTTGPARPADIRPGGGVVVWGRDPARVILVATPP